jgi:hypothetical protein
MSILPQSPLQCLANLAPRRRWPAAAEAGASPSRHPAASPPARAYRALAGAVFDLLGLKRGRTIANWTGGEISIPADDLSSIRCLRDTYRDRATGCDRAEFYAPNGRLVWEEVASADDESTDGELEGASWSS